MDGSIHLWILKSRNTDLLNKLNTFKKMIFLVKVHNGNETTFIMNRSRKGF